MVALTSTSIDPDEAVETVGSVLDTLKQFDFVHYVWMIVLPVVCIIVMKILIKLLDRTLDRLKVELSLHNFIKSVVKVLLWLVTIIIVAGYLGVEVSSLVTVLGVVGLAIGLAIQGTLANLAGGIMILVSKPFQGGDVVETDDISGVVAEVNMVYTKIKTFDNKCVFIPNGQMADARIVNYTREDTRRVDLKFCVAYECGQEQVKDCLLRVVGEHPQAVLTPPPFARVSAFLDSSVEYTLRVWCVTGDYWTLYHDLLEQVRAAFEQEGIALTYNHLNVHLVEARTEEPPSSAAQK